MRSFFLLCLLFCVFLPPTAAQTPIVRSFAPSVAPPGALVRIEGQHFTGATFVSFNRISARFIVNSDTQITAQSPTGDTSGPIQVIAPSGSAVSLKSFHPGIPKVTLLGLTPSDPRPNTLARLTGTGFATVKAVHFDGRPARFHVLSDTQISVLVPVNTKPSPVTVTTPYGSATLK
jgi:hypothetical protein